MPLKITADADDLDHLITTGALQPHLAVPSLPAFTRLTAGAPSFAPHAAIGALTEAPPIPTPSSAPASLPASAPPDLAKPTQKQSNTAGKSEFQAGMPQVQSQPFTPGYYKEKQEQLDYKQAHPWGSPISEHPGFAGKVGHVLGEVENIAGNALVPEVMANVPGTKLNEEKETNQNKKGEEESVESEQKQSQSDLEKAQAAGLPSEVSLHEAETQKALADALAALNPQAKTDFEAWQKQNPNAPVSDWLKLQTQTKPPSTEQDTARATQLRADQAAGRTLSPADADWLKGHIAEKTTVPQFTVDNRTEQGSYLPVPDPADPLHKIIGWVDPKSGHFRSLADIQMGPGHGPISGDIKPTGQEASREGQAQVVTRAADGLTKDIEANRDKIGNVEAILKSAFLNTPLADKDLSGLATEIASFAALQPAMHGFRGQQAMDEFVKIIGGVPKNADALLSSIAAIKKTAGYFDPNSGGGNAAPAPGAPPSFADWKKGTK